MTKYILHGGYTSEINDLNQGYFSEMVNDIPDGGSILLVYFAVADEKVDDKFSRDCERVKSYAGERSISIVKATKEDFLEQLEKTDVIYIRGGDTKKLKTTLDKYPDFINKLKGKVVSGSSAGAYVLSKYYFTNTESKVLEGYGCVPIRIVCHYESTKHPVVGETNPVVEMGKYDNKLELVLLKDYEWRVFSV